MKIVVGNEEIRISINMISLLVLAFLLFFISTLGVLCALKLFRII